MSPVEAFATAIEFSDGEWSHFRRTRGSVFSAAVFKFQASKHYIESLPIVPKDRRSCFSQGERSPVQLPLDCVFALWNCMTLIDIWKTSAKSVIV